LRVKMTCKFFLFVSLLRMSTRANWPWHLSILHMMSHAERYLLARQNKTTSSLYSGSESTASTTIDNCFDSEVGESVLHTVSHPSS
jgi:hypothetical protein